MKRKKVNNSKCNKTRINERSSLNMINNVAVIIVLIL